MRRKSGWLAVAVVLAGLTTALPAGADHSQSTGINCSNFAFQEDAQAYFVLHPGDPEGLDGPPGPAFDGIQNVACENLPHRPATATIITGSTATGGSTSSGGSTATGGSTTSGGGTSIISITPAVTPTTVQSSIGTGLLERTG